MPSSLTASIIISENSMQHSIMPLPAKLNAAGCAGVNHAVAGGCAGIVMAHQGALFVCKLCAHCGLQFRVWPPPVLLSVMAPLLVAADHYMVSQQPWRFLCRRSCPGHVSSCAHEQDCTMPVVECGLVNAHHRDRAWSCVVGGPLAALQAGIMLSLAAAILSWGPVNPFSVWSPGRIW